MAVRKINYKDKSPLQTKPEIPEENKVNAEDLNQIKEVVNNNADEIELRQLKEEGKGLSKNDFTDELKAKLESLNNYNDTEIKKEINEINKKVAENTENDIKQDTEIETLKNNYTNLQKQNTKLESQIKKDRENMINLEVEGQSIHVEDSSDLEGQLEVLGNAEQDVREGYNILENILTDRTVNGITVKINKDKSITLNGTATENTSLDITKNFTITEESVFSGMCDGYGYNKMLIQIQGSDYNVNIPNSTPQVLQPKDNVKVRIYIYAGTNMTNALIKPQINKGNVTKLYEAYGASPSPEYPSEIRAVGDNINLLENTAKTQTVNGVTFTVNEDGTVIANGTATSLAQISLVANVKLPTGTYTIKDGKAYVESTEFNDWFDGLATASTLTFNTEVLLKNVYIQVKQGETVNNKIFYPKLEKGTAATSYSKFGQGSVEIKKQNKNIILIKPNQKVVTRGLTVETDDNARITINGIAENITYLKLYKEIAGTYLSEAEKWKKEKIAKGNYRLSIQNLKGNYNTGNPNILMRNSPNSNTEISYLLQELNKDKSIKCTIDKSMEVMWYMYIQKDVTFNNFSFELLLEKTERDEYSDYVLGEEQTYILPIQKPMLEEDYFNRTDNKEVHTWKKIILDGVNNKVTQETTATNGKYRYKYTDKDFKNCSLSEEKAYCTHLQLIEKNKTYDKMVGFTVSNGALLIYTDGDTAVNFNAKLQKENYIFYIPVIESAYEKIDLTPKQIEVLDQLDNLETYKPVTNITTDSIAKLKLKYIADTKTYIDNKTSNLEQQVNTINQLLSTTRTSSVLLDNLQKDIESEVL